jgi:methylglyoxal synthase
MVASVGTVEKLTRHPAGSMIVTVGIVAHDAKKEELALFARAHRRALQSLRLIAPEDTARALAEAGVEAQGLAQDALGGDLQLAAAVVDGTVDAVFFFNDPLATMAGDPEIRTMLKVCDLERIPLATNITAAEIVLAHLAAVRDVLDPEPRPRPRVVKFAER